MELLCRVHNFHMKAAEDCIQLLPCPEKSTLEIPLFYCFVRFTYDSGGRNQFCHLFQKGSDV